MLNWVLSIGSTVIITSVIMIILPSGKLSTIIKSIFSLVVLLVVISPIIKITKVDFEIENLFFGEEITVQDDFLHFIGESKIKAYKDNCRQILVNMGVEDALFDIDYLITDDYFIDVQRIMVDLRNSVIKSDKAHIDIIGDVKEAFSEYFSIDVGRIEIYG